MNIFKITNITNTINKRDYKYNSVLDIDYVDEMTRKAIRIKPGESVYLTINSLPLSAQKLRVKNFITVVEISSKELTDVLNKNVGVSNVKSQNNVSENEEDKSVKKYNYKKKNENKV